MPSYVFGENSYSSEDETWQRVLQKAYAAKLRPVCRCVDQLKAPALYIAMISGTYVVKRIPFTGPLHAAHCTHYEPPAELSGLGQVSGTAIKEGVDGERTALLLDFALSKGRSRPVSHSLDAEHDSVRTDGTKLTLRALLHYLYDQAGLSTWSPNMEGKRTWYVVRRELLTGAESKFTKGRPLADLLFIPETFVLDRVAEISSRNLAALAPVLESADARMLLIGEVKSLDDARYGMTLVIKHLPDVRFSVPVDLAKRIVKRFGYQLDMWGQIENSRLLAMCTFSRSALGVMCVESACLMNVDQQWIPFESVFEWQLLETLHNQDRRFMKGLRYNLPSSAPIASVVLQDTVPQLTALFVVPEGSEGEFEAVADDLATAANMSTWWWRPASGMPQVPEKQAPRLVANTG